MDTPLMYLDNSLTADLRLSAVVPLLLDLIIQCNKYRLLEHRILGTIDSSFGEKAESA